MIKVGDTYEHDNNYYKITKVNFKEREVYIQNINVNKSYDTDIRTFENIFWSWYLREKKRADELEAMWNDLRGHVIARSDVCKERRMIRERDALIDVMAAMHDLEEEKQ